MLDGRVLGASQVEYKPFRKPPLKREFNAGNAGIPWRNPALNSPQSLIQRASTQVPTQVPFVPFVFTFLPRQAAEPSLSPGSLLYALNCFNMSEYMSDEHVLGTPGAPPCRATCPAKKPPRPRHLPGIGATRQPAESYGSYGSYGHTVIRRLGTAPPAAPARHRSLPGRTTCPA